MTDDLFGDIQEYLKGSKDFEQLDKEQFGNIVTDDEVVVLIQSFAAARGDEGFSEDEVLAVVRWAESIRIQESLLALVLDGLAVIDYLPETKDFTFALTEKGRITAESDVV